MKKTEVRSELRIAALKQQPRVATRLMNVKVPAKVFAEVERIAERLDVSADTHKRSGPTPGPTKTTPVRCSTLLC